MRILTARASGRILLEGVAELINKENRYSGLADYSEVWDADMVGLWVEREDEMFRLVAAVTEAGRVVGFALINGWGCGISPVIDPGIPAWLVEEVASALIAVGSSALRGMGCGGLIKVSAGVMGGFRHRLIREVAGHLGEEVSGVLMVLKRLARHDLPPGYVVRCVRPHEERGALEDIVVIRNEAFAEHGWEPVSADDVRPYYADLLRRYPHVYVAIAYSGDGDPAGYAEAFAHRALSGRLAGEVSMVAVRPGHRGRGLGAYLVTWACDRLLEVTPRIYLHAVGTVRGFYHRLGFADEAWFVNLSARPLIGAAV